MAKLTYRQAAEVLGITRLSLTCGVGRTTPPSEMDVAVVLALDMAVQALVEKSEQEKTKKATSRVPT